MRGISFTKMGRFALLAPAVLAIGSLSHAQVTASCIPTYSSGCILGDNIDGVTLVGVSVNLSNLATPCQTGGYQDYTTSTTLGVPDLVPNQIYSGTVSTSYTSASEYALVWIDWDNNGVFATSELAATLPAIGGATVSAPFTFTVPAGAPLGVKRMRIGLAHNAALTSACGSTIYGETHDYKVVVLSLSGCNNPPVAGTSTVTPAGQSCPGFSLQLNLS